jgi:hypothetical protein
MEMTMNTNTDLQSQIRTLAEALKFAVLHAHTLGCPPWVEEQKQILEKLELLSADL